MKTLSKKATEVLYTNKGTVQSNYVNAIKGSRFEGNKIYPVSWSGSGRHINLKDYSSYITTALRLGGYKYEMGNDAPRGGKKGFFIQCSSTAINFLILLSK